MADRAPRLHSLVGHLGRSALARRARHPRAGGLPLATAVLERRRPALLGSIARLAHGRSLAGLPRGPEPSPEPELYRPPGMSEFAARWLFGEETPAGIPFSDATAQAVLARSGTEAGPPSFLQKQDEEARYAAEADAARRAQPVARGRVEEGPSFRLSRTPRPVPPQQADDLPPEPIAPAPEPEPEPEPEQTASVAAAGRPLSEPVSTPEPPAATTPPASPRPVAESPTAPRPAVARIKRATSAAPRPEVAVRLIARTPAASEAAAPAGARPAGRKPSLFRRALDVLRSAPSDRGDAPPEPAAGIPAAPTGHGGLLQRLGVARAPVPEREAPGQQPSDGWDVVSAPPAAPATEPEPQQAPPELDSEPAELPGVEPQPLAIARTALEPPHFSGEQDEPAGPGASEQSKPSEAAAPQARVSSATLARLVSSQPRRVTSTPDRPPPAPGPPRDAPAELREPARPLVKLGAGEAARIGRSPAPRGTSATRLAAATGLPLEPGPNGTASVVLAPAHLDQRHEAGLALATGTAPAIARQEVAARPPAPVTVEAPSPPAGVAPPSGGSLDVEEVYEQVVERLRRDLLAERERMGDLLGDLRR